MRVFRIAQARHPGLDGEGAKLYGGRWNSAGVPVVYTSASRALAALEKLVWVDPEDLPDDLRLFELEIPAQASVQILRTEQMPVSWREPRDPFCSVYGNGWLASQRSAVLAVPSAIMPEEFNYLLNPLHPEMQGLRIAESRRFFFDSRLFKPRTSYVGRIYPPLPP